MTRKPTGNRPGRHDGKGAAPPTYRTIGAAQGSYVFRGRPSLLAEFAAEDKWAADRATRRAQPSTSTVPKRCPACGEWTVRDRCKYCRAVVARC